MAWVCADCAAAPRPSGSFPVSWRITGQDRNVVRASIRVASFVGPHRTQQSTLQSPAGSACRASARSPGWPATGPRRDDGKRHGAGRDRASMDGRGSGLTGTPGGFAMTALPRPGRRFTAGVALTLGLSAPVAGCAVVTTAVTTRAVTTGAVTAKARDDQTGGQRDDQTGGDRTGGPRVARCHHHRGGGGHEPAGQPLTELADRPGGGIDRRDPHHPGVRAGRLPVHRRHLRGDARRVRPALGEGCCRGCSTSPARRTTGPALTDEQGYRQHFAGTCPGQKTGPSPSCGRCTRPSGPVSSGPGTWALAPGRACRPASGATTRRGQGDDRAP